MNTLFSKHCVFKKNIYHGAKAKLVSFCAVSAVDSWCRLVTWILAQRRIMWPFDNHFLRKYVMYNCDLRKHQYVENVENPVRKIVFNRIAQVWEFTSVCQQERDRKRDSWYFITFYFANCRSLFEYNQYWRRRDRRYCCR